MTDAELQAIRERNEKRRTFATDADVCYDCNTIHLDPEFERTRPRATDDIDALLAEVARLRLLHFRHCDVPDCVEPEPRFPAANERQRQLLSDLRADLASTKPAPK
jgi:hypothetical protein